MTARQRLEQLGVPADALDAYELEVRRTVAAELYEIDEGTCGCGCRCHAFIDPDQPCPVCGNDGGPRLGQPCYLCGLERTRPEDPPGPNLVPSGPNLVPSQLYAGMLAHLLGTKPLLPRPTYTGVLQHLEDRDP